mmetsp:Transcript_17173/g.51268  ORF Transcript_17173/g.51268 Transcript_17173/m.51268 type:complete len:89 (-) Transcript_17173:151-417(-)
MPPPRPPRRDFPSLLDSLRLPSRYVAQWGRTCLKADACRRVNETALASPGSFELIVRHYLDAYTRTGPHRDALPRNRVFVFDLPPVKS